VCLQPDGCRPGHLDRVTADGLQGSEAVVDLCQPGEHGGQTLLGEDGPGAVLALVHCGVGLALDAQQRPQVGRPAQHGEEADVDCVAER